VPAPRNGAGRNGRNGGAAEGDLPARRPSGTPSGLPEILKHLTVALCRHVRQLHREGLHVPPEVEELAAVLICIARTRQVSPITAGESGGAHHVRMPDRLLVSKSEAAKRLGVSVRTIERLVATGRLPQVNVERLARFRVSDLEAFVNSLTESHARDPGAGDREFETT
jgi:excisionase family DNA binding protein